MTEHTDQTYLLNEEYDNAADLETRIQIQEDLRNCPLISFQFRRLEISYWRLFNL